MIFATARIDVPGILEIVPWSIRLVGFFLIYIFSAKHEVAAVERFTSDKIQAVLCARIHILEVSGIGFNGEPFVIASCDDVNNTGNRVSAVDRRCTVLQNLDAFNHGGWNGLIVTAIDGSLTVDQGQCSDWT